MNRCGHDDIRVLEHSEIRPPWREGIRNGSGYLRKRRQHVAESLRKRKKEIRGENQSQWRCIVLKRKRLVKSGRIYREFRKIAGRLLTIENECRRLEAFPGRWRKSQDFYRAPNCKREEKWKTYTNQSINQSIDRSNNQLINQSINRTINQSIDRSNEHIFKRKIINSVCGTVKNKW